MRRSSAFLCVGAVGVLALAGCGSSSDDSSGSAPSASSGTVTVFAAASLTESFTALGRAFEAAHTGTTVRFGFAASSALATQITNGAPADVFASASTKNMTQVVDAGDAAGPRNFASNVAEIVVPPDNPGKVTSIKDLGRSSVKVALCQTQVPCGALAQTVLENAGVTVKPVTEEADVKSTLTKVTTGEADAGVVYVTDVLAAGDQVKGVEIPADVNASTEYPIATVKGARNSTLAQQFVDYVLSAEGTAELKKAGFEAP